MYTDTVPVHTTKEDLLLFFTVKRRLSKRTSTRYSYNILRYHSYCVKNKTSYTKQSMESYLQYLEVDCKLHTNSINTHIVSLRTFLLYLKDRNIPCENFMENIQDHPIVERPQDVLSKEEVDRMLAIDLTFFKGKQTNSPLNFTYKAFTRFLYMTGCRYTDVQSLTCQYVTLNEGEGKAVFSGEKTKTKKTRSVYFTDPLVSEIRILLQGKKPEDLVFQNLEGHPLRHNDYRKYLKRVVEAAGITKHIKPHTFRRSYGTEQANGGVPVQEVAKILGHQNIQMTYKAYYLPAEPIIKSAMYKHPSARHMLKPTVKVNMLEDSIKSTRIHEDPHVNPVKYQQALGTFLSSVLEAFEN